MTMKNSNTILLLLCLFLIPGVSLAQDYKEVTYKGGTYYLFPEDFHPHKIGLKEYGDYANAFNLPDGKWIKFASEPPRVPLCIGTYENGVAEGMWYFYSVDWGNDTALYLTTEVPFINGKRDGEILYYHKPGYLYSRIGVLGMDYHGIFQTYDREGNATVSGNHSFGIPTGKWEFYREPDKLMKVETYVENISHEMVEYYKGSSIFFDAIEKAGPEASIILETANVDFIPTARGKWIEYFDNGSPMLEKTYTNGFVTYVKEYYKNGKVKMEGRCFAERDLSNYPLTRSYNPNREMPEPYIKTGTWKYYDEDGNLIEERH